MNMNTLVPYIIERLKEPSTYAGLGALLAAAGIHLSDAQVGSITALALAVGGALSVFLPERKS